MHLTDETRAEGHVCRGPTDELLFLCLLSEGVRDLDLPGSPSLVALLAFLSSEELFL